MPRKSKLTARRRELLLRRVDLGQTVSEAAEALGFSRSAVYRTAQRTPAFAKRFEAAREAQSARRQRPRGHYPVASHLAELHRRLQARWCNECATPDAETT
ncbi:helix-turn-helix domain-containing protein [Botrimarina sp.]|uniref:helix-turn-helix domain-containing protein n=1 Tax=Botrimarina sp. TaxID=2795802 RepID=UPI0032EFCAAB